jgi:cupin 2 domain-containing protein
MEPNLKNIFTHLPDQTAEEFFETLLKKNNLHLERIVSRGHVTPPGQWYDQVWDEWVLLLQGQATLLYENNRESLTMNAGDYLLIPAHTKHRVEW